ncbi:hypothetical protein GLYMA_07G207902v4 [Glycine max]|nr:hypothetical protein GLYMA_07G207902v4 [Glycine max]KAH1087814.1 hypothetical protein GYH30_019074 [Glycine max]KAH1087816.1 hypothetical protein GYH30_019074 [Glycine max]
MSIAFSLPLRTKYFSQMKLTSSVTILLFLKIQRSELALINPAITIILRKGAGGHGVPPFSPLGSPDGRVGCMFASFVDRNKALENLQRASKNFHEILEAGKENAEPELRALSDSARGSKALDKALEESMPKTGKLQPFIKEEALVGMNDEVLPCIDEQFSNLLLNDDGSNFSSKSFHMEGC